MEKWKTYKVYHFTTKLVCFDQLWKYGKVYNFTTLPQLAGYVDNSQTLTNVKVYYELPTYPHTYDYDPIKII